ncbi:MAG: ribonuclease, partial [Clostridiales bacterium]|nr:ribonuclease [Clostridiales bacterium]
DLGWDASRGNLWEVTDRMSIGGDRFGNREGLLPDQEGRVWYECDVNYNGGYRGAERLVYSNDGLIYYTDDHYQSFTRMY